MPKIQFFLQPSGSKLFQKKWISYSFKPTTTAPSPFRSSMHFLIRSQYIISPLRTRLKEFISTSFHRNLNATPSVTPSFESPKFSNPPPSALISNLFIPTLKPTPLRNQQKIEDEETSLQLLTRGGFIRQSASGIYTLLPFGLRTIQKIEAIIDKEMENIGAQKLSLPCLLNSFSWKKSGRWESTGNELFRLKDRKDTEFCLSPTHEEEITQLVGAEVSSYRQLPVRVYQIGRKYRDEMRPRSGLLRSREFIMKDLYTFDKTEEEAQRTYEDVFEAYNTIFSKIGIPFTRAEADTGNIGGSHSHEYHYFSKAGEDTLLRCNECGYTANMEKAVGIPIFQANKIEENSDSVTHTFRQWYHQKGFSVNDGYYNVYFFTNPEKKWLMAVLTSADGRKVNPLRLKKVAPKLDELHPISPELLLDKSESFPFTKLQVYVDTSVSSNHQRKEATNGMCSAFQIWLENLNPKSITVSQVDVHETRENDLCPKCATSEGEFPLVSQRAIEVGHMFILGTKYSASFDATYQPPPTSDTLEKKAIQMGCYGIGVTRLLSSIVECSHDKDGIKWPTAVSPYLVCIVPFTSKRTCDMEHLTASSFQLYSNFLKAHPTMFHNNVLIDNRNYKTGSMKMKEATLIGYSWMAVLGNKFLENNLVELQNRVTGKVYYLPLEDVPSVVLSNTFHLLD